MVKQNTHKREREAASQGSHNIKHIFNVKEKKKKKRGVKSCHMEVSGCDMCVF